METLEFLPGFFVCMKEGFQNPKFKVTSQEDIPLIF
jgi:hypothetical protein